MTPKQVARARAKIARKGYYIGRIKMVMKCFLYWAEQSNHAMMPGGKPLFPADVSDKKMNMFSKRLDYYLKKAE